VSPVFAIEIGARGLPTLGGRGIALLLFSFSV
jgi:hypothetical protein